MLERWLTVPRLWVIFYCTVFSVILWWVYANQLAPLLAISKVFYFPMSPVEDLACLVLAILPSLAMPTQVTKPSQFINWVLYITVVSPSCYVAPHILESRSNVWPLVVAVVVCFMITLTSSYLKPLKLPKKALGSFPFWTIAVVFSLITFAGLYAAYGTPNTSISFSTAEALRSAFKEKNMDAPMIVRYLYRWEANIIGPLCVAYGLIHRKWWLVIIGCGIEQLLFMFTTLRSFDLIPIMLIPLYIWINGAKKDAGVKFIGGMTFLNVLFCLNIMVQERALLALAYFYRFLFVGGQHTAYYYEYFTTHPPALLGASFGSIFWKPPYDREVGMVIGNAYYRLGSKTEGNNATAHLFAQGFANFLWPGVIITTLGAILIYWLIDSAFSHIDKRISIMLTIMIALSLKDSGLHTSILTAGILPLLFVGLLGGKVLKPTPPREKKAKRQREAVQLQPALESE